MKRFGRDTRQSYVIGTKARGTSTDALSMVLEAAMNDERHPITNGTIDHSIVLEIEGDHVAVMQRLVSYMDQRRKEEEAAWVALSPQSQARYVALREMGVMKDLFPLLNKKRPLSF